LLADASGLALSVELLAQSVSGKNIDWWSALKAVGLFWDCGGVLFVGGISARAKARKLPFKKVSMSYDLEYGSDSLEMHVDAIVKASVF